MFNLKNFTKACALLAATGQKANDMAHDLGVQALEHAFVGEKASGDIRPLDMVYKAMGEGRLRAEGFRVWAETFAPVIWNGDAEIKMIPKDNKRYHEPEVAAATKNPFWTLKQANEATPVRELSLAAIRAILKREMDKINATDANGQAFDKDGKLKYQIDGDVALTKDRAHQMQSALELLDPTSDTVRIFRLIQNDKANVVSTLETVAAPDPEEAALKAANAA